MGEHEAGRPVLMKPLSWKSSAAPDCGQLSTDHLGQLQSTSGTTCLVAASALYRAEYLQTLAETRPKWTTRVPASLRNAQVVCAQADPQTMAPLTAGDRAHVGRSSDGRVEHRWVLRSAAPRPVDQQLLQPSAPEVNASKQLCRTA